MTKTKERIKQTGEVFTPMELCLQMVHEIPEEKLRDPTTTYLDPAMGDGNFLVTLLQVLTEEYGHQRDHVVDHQLFGTELMADNVEVAKARLGVPQDHPHFICGDALKFDFNFDDT